MSEPAKILVVDDDHDLVTTLRLILVGAGYRVISAPDAEQGMARAEGERPDLILLDIMMPNATEGFHFVWKLRRREEPYFQTVPIVVLSAIHETTDLRFYPDSGDGTYRRRVPADPDFVDKLVDAARLLSGRQGAGTGRHEVTSGTRWAGLGWPRQHALVCWPVSCFSCRKAESGRSWRNGCQHASRAARAGTRRQPSS
jgi:CheY-like chemotaxis protein